MKSSVSSLFLLSCMVIGAAQFTGNALAAPTERVPVVGCPSDGQQGPMPPPEGMDMKAAPELPSSAARHLAYYETSDLSVLAPRGWSCFGLKGSSGASIIVTPTHHDAAEVFKEDFGLTEPAVQLSYSLAGTSGRFSVAWVAARLFPNMKRFVQAVIDEDNEASFFKFGPFPHDRLRRRSSRDVEFETPSNEEGMGTHSWLKKNGSPIEGVAIIAKGEESDLLQLSIRLPDELRSLAPVIIKELRQQ